MGPDAVAILIGATPRTRSADTHYPFRQDSDFAYLTGFHHPNAIAVLRTDGGPPFTLFVEPRVPAEETWTGIRPGVDGAVRDYGADEAHPRDHFLDVLPEYLEKARDLYHVLGRDSAIDAAMVKTIETLRIRSRAGKTPPRAIIDPRSILQEMRLIKEPGEIEIMRRAAAITAEAHEEAAMLVRGGTPEYEIAATLDFAFRRSGGNGPAYETIVGGGPNATILHYVGNDHVLEQGKMVLIDAGCELEGYASDVTRTYPIGGSFQAEGRAVYKIVLRAERAALAACKPGATLDDVHNAAVKKIVRGLVELGILSGEVPELVKAKAYKPYYMHGTSHWLGLDVHDVGAYTIEGKPRYLEPGMVFTVEPGLYFAAEDETVEPRFRGIGVRIEDNVLITKDGAENLTAAIPTQPEEVEAWVRGDE